jgi:hypothetical protein
VDEQEIQRLLDELRIRREPSPSITTVGEPERFIPNKLRWYDKAAFWGLGLGAGVFTLWISWPVWLAPLAAWAAWSAARLAKRRTSSDRLRRMLTLAERPLLVVLVIASSVFALHMGVIVWDWWVG